MWLLGVSYLQFQVGLGSLVELSSHSLVSKQAQEDDHSRPPPKKPRSSYIHIRMRFGMNFPGMPMSGLARGHKTFGFLLLDGRNNNSSLWPYG